MHISADYARCEGHGLCADFAPQVYDLDDDAVVVLKHQDVPGELEHLAEGGARACPIAALEVRR
ncbi:ferredoxin [Rhodococcoides fascians]|uniref:ferredoxin n=1 Tax=Rhodococcoides fascians TaxID=1828 RepID=UPI00050C3687|nr:ferredoxin [Rhodococcus fascians]